MIRLLAFTAAAAALASLSTAEAAEATQSVTVKATPGAVWAVIGQFDGIATWLPGAASSPADHGNTVGSVRVITLKAPGNPTVTEKLTAYHAASYNYSYAIQAVDPKVLPVTGYTSTISVKKAGEGSTVTWHGTFKPAGGSDKAAAEKAVGGLYQAGLANVKTLSEK